MRGTADWPLVLPGSSVPLPQGTKLVSQRTAGAREPRDYVQVAALPAGRRGLLFQTTWAVSTAPVGGPGAGSGYIEGCWTFYGTNATAWPGLVVGTGLEDYFDSAFYFGADSGSDVTLFATALSGLTLFDRDAETGLERLSAFRFHNHDPLVFTDAGQLLWQVGAGANPQGLTKCGNARPADVDADHTVDAAVHDPTPVGRQLTAVNLTTTTLIFVLPWIHPRRLPRRSSS